MRPLASVPRSPSAGTPRCFAHADHAASTGLQSTPPSLTLRNAPSATGAAAAAAALRASEALSPSAAPVPSPPSPPPSPPSLSVTHCCPRETCSNIAPMVRSRRRASCRGEPRWSRRGTRSPSSYTSSPIVGIMSTVSRVPPTVSRTFAVSTAFAREASDSAVFSSTSVTPSSGRRHAYRGSSAVSDPMVTSRPHCRRQTEMSRSAGGAPRSRSRT
mmetsp:Transcript_623/g.1958  ORF Transcript_623/g.1958 Transcript_623/m.1958 type:complete len:216 (-) Transcript_623:330-977(-)